jgi:hypothetical protein
MSSQILANLKQLNLVDKIEKRGFQSHLWLEKSEPYSPACHGYGHSSPMPP